MKSPRVKCQTSCWQSLLCLLVITNVCVILRIQGANAYLFETFDNQHL